MTTKGKKRLASISLKDSEIKRIKNYKKRVACLIDDLEPIMDLGGEAGRCAKIAQYKFEEAAMWAVKAMTKPRGNYG
jgi:hypothetical protein